MNIYIPLPGLFSPLNRLDYPGVRDCAHRGSYHSDVQEDPDASKAFWLENQKSYTPPVAPFASSFVPGGDQAHQRPTLIIP